MVLGFCLAGVVTISHYASSTKTKLIENMNTIWTEFTETPRKWCFYIINSAEFIVSTGMLSSLMLPTLKLFPFIWKIFPSPFHVFGILCQCCCYLSRNDLSHLCVVHSLFNPSGPVSRAFDFILLMSTFVLWFGLPVLFDFWIPSSPWEILSALLWYPMEVLPAFLWYWISPCLSLS